jgi:XTP/dITP diphosphohydrolase
MMELLCVTGNSNKAREVADILSRYGIEVRQADLDLPEVQSDSVEEVARLFAAEAYGRLKAPLIVEDAGLFIEALKGFPGAYSAYVFRTIGNGGILKLMEGLSQREATFRSAIAYCGEGAKVRVFVGEAPGEIALRDRGTYWGFDPIFIPREGDGRTYAEMGKEVKDGISHRRKALDKLAAYLRTTR